MDGEKQKEIEEKENEKNGREKERLLDPHYMCNIS